MDTLLDFVIRNQVHVLPILIFVLGFMGIWLWVVILDRVRTGKAVSNASPAPASSQSKRIKASPSSFAGGAVLIGLVGTSSIFDLIPRTVGLTMPEPEHRLVAGAAERTPDNLIIFLHGWRGDDTTWKRFPELVKQDEAIDADVWSIHYPTYMMRRSARISDLADGLEDKINAKGFHQRYKKIAIIAHSMGGLIGRKMVLLASLSEGHPRAFGPLIEIATPHLGAALASLADTLHISQELTEEMAKDSSFLTTLRKDWERLGNRPGVRPDTYCFTSPHDNVVTTESAIFQCDSSVTYPQWGHQDMAKPENAEDDRYVLPISKIRKHFGAGGTYQRQSSTSPTHHRTTKPAIEGSAKPKHMADNAAAGLGRLPDVATRQKMVRLVEEL